MMTIDKLGLGFMQVSLLTENGNTKDDLRLPTDDSLLTQVSAEASGAIALHLI